MVPARVRPKTAMEQPLHVHLTNTSNLPVEALEIEYPLTLLRYELVDGSGGAGRYRGGMGLRRVYRAEAPCRVRVDIARRLSAPWGLFDGLPGGKADVVLRGGAAPFDHGSGGLRAGEIIEVMTAGSGGYGPPEQREPDMVRRDVAEDRIDATAAAGCTGFYHDSTDRRSTLMRLTCRSLPTAGAALPHCASPLAPPPRRAASCLASPHPPTMAPWQEFPHRCRHGKTHVPSRPARLRPGRHPARRARRRQRSGKAVGGSRRSDLLGCFR